MRKWIEILCPRTNADIDVIKQEYKLCKCSDRTVCWSYSQTKYCMLGSSKRYFIFDYENGNKDILSEV